MIILKINGLNVNYGDFQALRGIELEVHKNQIVSLMGANSAGKSTLLKAITGILKPSAGTITFDHQRIDGLPPHDIVALGMALVPQGRKIFSNLTVRQNLFIGSYTPRSRKTRSDTIEKVLKLFPVLKGRFSQKGTDLSGGEQQMLAIGRALMSQPHFLFFDEISLGLSPLVIKEMYRTIREMNRAGMTTVIVEQDVNRNLKVSDFAYILQEGKITLKGNPRYFSETVVRKAYFGL